MALFGRRNPLERTPRTPEAPPSLNTEEALSGVNWDDYKTQGPERNPHPNAGLRIRPYNPSHTYQEPFSVMDSARWRYTKELGEAETRGLDKLNRITSRRGLPEGYSLHVHSPIKESHYANSVDLVHNGFGVGSVEWEPETGHVLGLNVDEGHRHLTPHLIAKAHEVSHEQGKTGPTSSGSLSAYSYKLLQRHAPEFLPDYASVEGVHVSEYEPSLMAHDEANYESSKSWRMAKPHLQAIADKEPDASGLKQNLTRHEIHLNNISKAIRTGKLGEASAEAGNAYLSASNLYSLHKDSLPPSVAAHLVNHVGKLQKLSEGDFSEEIYGS